MSNLKYPKLNEFKTLELLLKKEVSSAHIKMLHKKRPISINSELYTKYKEEEDAIIPVNKIVATHRIHCYQKNSFWETLFNNKFHNVNLQKWNDIENAFRVRTLSNFRNWFKQIPPLETAYYFKDFDMYTIGEGHHRTCWAILADVKDIKIKTLYTYSLNPGLVNERKKTLRFKQKILKEISNYEKILLAKISDYNFKYAEDKFIKYKDMTLLYFKKEKVNREYSEIELVHYLDDLKDLSKSLDKIINVHKKWRVIPFKRFRFKSLKVHAMFSYTKEKEIVYKLYSRKWDYTPTS